MQSVWPSAIGRHLVAMAVSATAVADALMMRRQQASRMVRIRMTRLTLNERLRCRPRKAVHSFALTRNDGKVYAVLRLVPLRSGSAERRGHQAERRAAVRIGDPRIEHDFRPAERR